MKRDPSGASLERFNKQNTRTSVHIAQPQMQSFSKTKPGAVKDEKQSPVELCSEGRPLQLCTKCQQVPDVLFGKKIRDERRFRWQARPNGFLDWLAAGKPPQIGEELTENRGIIRDTDGFTFRFTG